MKKRTWIDVHKDEQIGSPFKEQYPNCKGCIYVAEDIVKYPYPPHSYGYNQQRCKKFPGTDFDSLSDFKPNQYAFADGEKCPYKKTK